MFEELYSPQVWISKMNEVWFSELPVFLNLLSDFDKSRKGSHLCDANANCINTSGSYNCFVPVRKNAKKDLGQYPAILTEEACPIKDLSYNKRIPLY